jgi:DNA (cytosine-5)-methyltransferase 1
MAGGFAWLSRISRFPIIPDLPWPPATSANLACRSGTAETAVWFRGRPDRKIRMSDSTCSHGELVLSLFPGLDLLGRAFRESGFCVVTGPDVLWGTRIEDFDAKGLAGRFDGIIGGPPCQDFSSARRSKPSGEGVRLLGEYLRVVTELQPTWFLLENVPRVPDVRLDGYTVQRLDIWDLECGGTQLRARHIQFGHLRGWIIRPRRLKVTDRGSVRPTRAQPAAMARYRRGGDFRRHCLAQGLPGSLRLPGLSRGFLWSAVGNGVPLTMGRVLAESVAQAGPRDPSIDCRCGCGRPVTGRQDATAACRKRIERERRGLRRCVVTWP